MQRFNFDLVGHTTVIGKTRNGKTYTVNRLLKDQSHGVLFFNVQRENLPGYIKIDAMTPFVQIRDLLKKGHKLNYIPKTRLETQHQELTWLIDKLFEHGNFTEKSYIYLVIDEVHLFKKQTLSQVKRVATGGLKFGLRGVWLSQRPAEIDNTLMTQSTDMLIFFCSMESRYFKQYEIPIEEILKRIETNGQYSYCSYDFTTLKDYKKI